MPDATPASPAAQLAPPLPPPAVTRPGWTGPLVRVALVVLASLAVWLVATNWNGWFSEARRQRTEDAYLAADVTPLAAKVSGYIARVPVQDFQTVKAGDVLAEIDDTDYRTALDQALAALAATEAVLANLPNQRAIQRALIEQARATIAGTGADLLRFRLEDERQRTLLQTRIAGTPQLVEQAEANERRTAAQLQLHEAQLAQRMAELAGLDIQEKQLQANVRGAEAAVQVARNNLGYTRVLAPADGMAGQRQVRPGQYVGVGSQVATVIPLPNVWVIANYKETQMARVRPGQPAKVTVDAFPGGVLTGHVDGWSPGTGSTFALLPPDNATGNFTKVVQRVPVKIVLDPDKRLGTLMRPGMSVEATIDTGAGGPAP